VLSDTGLLPGKISAITVAPPPEGDHGDLLSKAKESDAVWGVYGPGAVVAWQFLILLAILQGLHLSLKPAKPTSSSPLAKSNALILIATLPICLGRLILQDLEFVFAVLLPAIAACDVLIRTCGPAANFQVTDFKHLTKFLSYSSSPWLDLHAEPHTSHPGQLWVGIAPHVPAHIVDLLAGDIQTLQSCVALMELFLKVVILLFAPIMSRLVRARSLRFQFPPWEQFRLLLGALVVTLVAAAGRRLRGYPAELGFSEETQVQLSQGLVSMSRMDPTATTNPDLFSASLALKVPCYPTLLRWLFNQSVLHPSTGRADLPNQWYLGPHVIILFLLTVWLAVLGACFRFSARYGRYIRMCFVVCLPPVITILVANLLLLCVGPFLLATGLCKGGVSCVYRASRISFAEPEQIYELLVGVTVSAIATVYHCEAAVEWVQRRCVKLRDILFRSPSDNDTHGVDL
jgi:hypothetical protein